MKRPALLRIQAYLDRVVADGRLPMDIRVGAVVANNEVNCALISLDLREQWDREDAARVEAAKEKAHA